MLNVLLLETKSTIHRHINTSKFVVCIYGSAIERFYVKQGYKTEMVDFQIAVQRKCMKGLTNK